MAASTRPEMRTLGDMLQHERFLAKVLGYLIPHGLHECRLVCRQWYNVCQRFPVELAISDAKHAHEIAEKFPNTVAVKAKSRMVFSYMYTNCILAAYLRHLTPLKKLKRLEIIVQGAFVLSEEIDICFAALSQLEYLEVRLPLKYAAALRFYNALRHLTRLTGLKISHWDVHIFAAEPLTQLQKLQYIDCACYHPTNETGEFLFPSTTHLKKLSVTLFKSLIAQTGRPGLPELFRPYASSVEELKICSYADKGAKENYSALSAFTRLTALEMEFNGLTDSNFYPMLREMPQLKALRITRMDISSAEAMGAVCSLSALRSLAIEPACETRRADNEAPLAQMLSQLTALTQLSVKGPLLTAGIFKLKQLRDFEIQVTTGLHAHPMLTVLTNLERLSIYSAGLHFPEGLLTNMTSLKALTVDCVVVDEDFLPSIASLPQLTCLKYESSMDSNDRPEQINLLTHLVKLTALTEERHHPLGYIKKHALPHLQVFRARCDDLDADEKQELHDRLPALRHFESQYSWMYLG